MILIGQDDSPSYAAGITLSRYKLPFDGMASTIAPA